MKKQVFILLFCIILCSCVTLKNDKNEIDDYIGSWKIENKSSLDIMKLTKEYYEEKYIEKNEDGSIKYTLIYSGTIDVIKKDVLEMKSVTVEKYDGNGKIIEESTISVKFYYELTENILKIRYENHDFYHHYEKMN